MCARPVRRKQGKQNKTEEEEEEEEEEKGRGWGTSAEKESRNVQSCVSSAARPNGRRI
ncbi:hypothetical protein LX36DRAFT_654578 [Colletotrichum falcatum]|nr:hypothetical protein LX36DRAFT_654578 [Colletotrichum falcatum]